MLTADIVIMVAFIVFVLLGVILGFGRGLKFITSGIFGIIISIFVCYLIFGLVLDISFVKDLCDDLLVLLENSGSVGSFFASIHIDFVVLAIVLFLIVQILRIIIVKIIKGVVEINNPACKVINKVLGAVFFALLLIAVVLILFQIVALIGGTTAENFLAGLDGSLFGLDALYNNNPLLSIIS